MESIKIMPDQLDGEAEKQERSLLYAELRREDRMEQAQSLDDLGWAQREIAHQLHIHPIAVHHYLRSPYPNSRRSGYGRLLDPFKPYLLEGWNQGYQNATQLYRELQEKGFAGHESIILIFICR
jgi:predicted transcriptional regulator